MVLVSILRFGDHPTNTEEGKGPYYFAADGSVILGKDLRTDKLYFIERLQEILKTDFHYVVKIIDNSKGSGLGAVVAAAAGVSILSRPTEKHEKPPCAEGISEDTACWSS